MSTGPKPAAPHDELVLFRDDQDRTLAAMHELEAALAAPAPGREPAWRDAVLAALGALDDATTTEAVNAARLDSLVFDIARVHPRLRSRVHGLRAQYSHVRDNIASLRRDLEDSKDTLPDFADLRHRLSWLLTTLRHQRARESDLILRGVLRRLRRRCRTRPKSHAEDAPTRPSSARDSSNPLASSDRRLLRNDRLHPPITSSMFAQMRCVSVSSPRLVSHTSRPATVSPSDLCVDLGYGSIREAVGTR